MSQFKGKPYIQRMLKENIMNANSTSEFANKIYHDRIELFLVSRVDKHVMYATDGHNYMLCMNNQIARNSIPHPYNSIPTNFYSLKNGHPPHALPSKTGSQVQSQSSNNPRQPSKEQYQNYCFFRPEIELSYPAQIITIEEYSLALVNIDQSPNYAPALVLRSFRLKDSLKIYRFQSLKMIIHEDYVIRAMEHYKQQDKKTIQPCFPEHFQDSKNRFSIQPSTFYSYNQVKNLYNKHHQRIVQSDEIGSLLHSLNESFKIQLQTFAKAKEGIIEIQQKGNPLIEVAKIVLSYIPMVGNVLEKSFEEVTNHYRSKDFKQEAEILFKLFGKREDAIKLMQRLFTVFILKYQTVFAETTLNNHEISQIIKQILRQMVINFKKENSNQAHQQKLERKLRIFKFSFSMTQLVFLKQPKFAKVEAAYRRVKDQTKLVQKFHKFLKIPKIRCLSVKQHRQVKRLSQRSEQSWKEHQYVKAIQDLQQIFSLISREREQLPRVNLPSNNNKSQIYWKTQARIKFLLQQYDQCVKISSYFQNDYFSLNQKGECYQELREFKKAQRCFQAALQLCDEEDRAKLSHTYNLIGINFLYTEQYAKAMVKFSQASVLNPQQIIYKSNKVLAYFENGDKYLGERFLYELKTTINTKKAKFNQQEIDRFQQFLISIEKYYPFVKCLEINETLCNFVEYRIKEGKLSRKGRKIQTIAGVKSRHQEFYVGLLTYLQDILKKLELVQYLQFFNIEDISRFLYLFVPILGEALRDVQKLKEILFNNNRKYSQWTSFSYLTLQEKSYQTLVDNFCQNATNWSIDALQRLKPQTILPSWLQQFSQSLFFLKKQVSQFQTILFGQQQVPIMQRYGSKVACDLLYELLSIQKQNPFFLTTSSSEQILGQMLHITESILSRDLIAQYNQQIPLKVIVPNTKDIFVRKSPPFSLIELEQSNELSLTIKCEIYKEIHGYYGPKVALFRKLALISSKVPKGYLGTLIRETTIKRGYQRLVKPEIIDSLNEQRETFTKELEEIRYKRTKQYIIGTRRIMDDRQRKIERIILEQAGGYDIANMLHLLKQKGIPLLQRELRKIVIERVGEVWDDISKSMDIPLNEQISSLLTKKQKENKAEGCEEPKEEKMDKDQKKKKEEEQVFIEEEPVQLQEENEEKKGDQNKKEEKMQPEP